MLVSCAHTFLLLIYRYDLSISITRLSLKIRINLFKPVSTHATMTRNARNSFTFFFLSNCVNIVVKIAIDWVTSVENNTIFKIQSSFVAQHETTRFRIHIFCFCHSSHFSMKIIVLKFPIFYANTIFLNHADQNRQRINHFWLWWEIERERETGGKRDRGRL